MSSPCRSAVLVSICSALLAAAPASAQVTPDDYRRAFGLRESWEHLTRNVADRAVWVDDTRFHYRRTAPGGHEFVLVDAATLEKRPAFDHDRLAAALAAATGEPQAANRLPFTDFSFSDDERAIVFGAVGARWGCTLDEYRCEERPPPRPAGRPTGFGVVRDLAAPFDDSPRVSPDGRWEALGRDHDLIIRPAGGGEPVAASTDGSADDFYDHASIVWSPDSRALAVSRVRPGTPRQVHFVDHAPRDQLQPRHFTRLYPKPGDDVDIERPVIFHVDGPRLVVSDSLFPNPYRLLRLEWRADGRALTFEYNERGHQRYRVIEVDAETGEARALVDERAETFFNYPPATGQLRGSGTYFRHDVDDGREIVWMSERDGWRHVYLYDGETGAVKNRITDGEFVVRQVVHVDETDRRIWFKAGGMNPHQDPYFGHYYSVNFDGSGLTALTEADAYHEASFSPDMEHYVVAYSRVDLPTVLELRRTSDGSVVTELERGDISALLDACWTPPEVFSAKGRDGETDIWGIIVRPTDFDASKRYPVIENIYAGPHGSFVPKAFVPFLPHSGGDGIIGMQENAGLLQGDLMLVVGALDTNVDPAATMQVVAALIDEGKDFDLLVVPSDGHATGRTTGPVEYVTRRKYDFFVRNLRGETTPRWNRSAVPLSADGSR